jgi:hypothetical protein
VTIAIRPSDRGGTAVVKHDFRKKEIEIFLQQGLDRGDRIETFRKIGFSAQAVSRRECGLIQSSLMWRQIDVGGAPMRPSFALQKISAMRQQRSQPSIARCSEGIN